MAYAVEVRAVRRLSPSFLRITFGGDRLEHFAPCQPRDLRIKLMIPSPGHGLPDLGELSDGWYAAWLALDPAVRGSMRTYTVRALRPAGRATELDVDVVLHLDEHGRGGPASTWAAAARPGDPLTLLGPTVAAGATPGGIEWRPPVPRAGAPVRVLLAGDETAVPAVSSVLDGLGDGYVGDVLLEVPHATDVQDVRTPRGVRTTWLARGDRPHGEALGEALRALLSAAPPVAAAASTALPEVDLDADLLWETAHADGGFYAWVAGEAAVVRDLRRCLVTEHGVDRRSVAFMGYWRLGRAEGPPARRPGAA
jgi:NADPH-dependent ferric siderophore reductase